ncbi:MAG: hypothetical protein JWO19_1539 [Bryobacterales bacterium]|nr:hypothetical protein [Bryobacterales bacterium]
MVHRFLLLAVTSLVLFATDPLADSAQKKLDSISERKLKPGSVVTLSPAEINAWIHEKALKAFPEGIRNERVELGTGTVDGTALVDLAKIGKAKGQDVNSLIARLIEGERPLKVSIRVESANGRATVFLTHVELSGVAIDGSILDFLIKHFVQPRYPDIKINEPFDLDFNIDRIEIQPAGVRVVLKK